MAAMAQTRDMILITDEIGRIQYANHAFEEHTGYSRREVVGRTPQFLNSGHHDGAFYRELWDTIRAGHVWTGHFINKKKDGTTYQEDATISPVCDETGAITNFIAVKRDVTARLAMEQELGQARKLESIGQLAAGIAHEINTPTQYVGDNTRFLQDAFTDVCRIIRQAGELGAAIDKGDFAQAAAELRATTDQADIDYLTTEIPRAIQESLEGIGRVTEIVAAMKEFSHPGGEERTSVDINRSIQTTITVARNEWKYVAELETVLDPELPRVRCLPGALNQVILNLIVNAAHAIVDAVRHDPTRKGAIRVSSTRVGEAVEIRVSDNGDGIPEGIRARIFDPFFTTKEVGKGTGQGLSIAHTVIVQKHGGTITFESETGQGTTFTVRLPIEDVAPVSA
jgi:PAS domain S-box-containing protein